MISENSNEGRIEALFVVPLVIQPRFVRIIIIIEKLWNVCQRRFILSNSWRRWNGEEVSCARRYCATLMPPMMQYAWWWLFDSRRWRCMHVLAHKGLGADATSINRIVVRLLFVSNDSSLRLETSNKTQLQFWWLYLFHIYNEFITDEATISIRPLIRCNPIVFVYFNLTMLRARDSTKFYFQRCDHHSKCKTIKSYVTMVYDQIFRVYTKFLRLQEFRKWKLKEISSYDKKYIYIFFSLLLTNVTSRNFCGHCL